MKGAEDIELHRIRWKFLNKGIGLTYPHLAVPEKYLLLCL